MLRHLARRAALGVLVLWLVTSAVFVLLRIAPTPVERIVGGPRASAETLALIRRNLGLDQPAIVQYGRFLRHTCTGDLGFSFVNGISVSGLIASRLPATLWLVGGAAVLWLAGGVAIGVLSAVRARGPLDRASSVVVLIGLSTPPFLLAMVLLDLCAGRLSRLTGVDLFASGPYVPPWPDPAAFLQHMALPWFSLAFLMLAVYTRLTRGSLIDVLGEDYIRTARAKGLPERRVVWRHGLRSALTPVMTQFGVEVGALIGSTIVTEKVFGLQGVGQLVQTAVVQGDTPVILGVTMVTALFVVVAALLVDLLYVVLDPRVRFA
ncbi:MAG: ABC transporter permease [Actinomadura sp.]